MKFRFNTVILIIINVYHIIIYRLKYKFNIIEYNQTIEGPQIKISK